MDLSHHINRVLEDTLEPTGSTMPSNALPVVKPVIRLPKTVAECHALKEWADSQPDGPVPITPERLGEHLSFMSAALPRQAQDRSGGERKLTVYAAIIGKFSDEAIAFMARRACETLNWFPTPNQCLEILAAYTAAPGERDQALHYCQKFWQGRLEAFMAALAAGVADQAMVDEVPRQWRMIAMEKGYLRQIEDGSFIIRPRPSEALA